MQILFERNPAPGKLEVWGVYDWPLWNKDVSEFEWTYKVDEACYLLDGHIIVTPTEGEPMEFFAGDYITFPAGLTCRWQILEEVNKHYRLG